MLLSSTNVEQNSIEDAPSQNELLGSAHSIGEAMPRNVRNGVRPASVSAKLGGSGSLARLITGETRRKDFALFANHATAGDGPQCQCNSQRPSCKDHVSREREALSRCAIVSFIAAILFLTLATKCSRSGSDRWFILPLS